MCRLCTAPPVLQTPPRPSKAALRPRAESTCVVCGPGGGSWQPRLARRLAALWRQAQLGPTSPTLPSRLPDFSLPACLPAKFAGEKAKQALMNKIGKAPVVCEQARLLLDSVRLAELHGRVPRLLCVPCLVPSCCPTPHPCAATLSLPVRADETTRQVCCSVCSTNMLLCML